MLLFAQSTTLLLHLGPMLARLPFMLATFVNERKHRVVKKYTRDRRSLQSFDLGAIEEITCHQIWELGKPILSTFNTAKPSRRMVDVLREVFPATTGDASFMIANDMKVNGGAANAGDVVSCNFEGEEIVGELMLGVVVSDLGGRDAIFHHLEVADAYRRHCLAMLCCL